MSNKILLKRGTKLATDDTVPDNYEIMYYVDKHMIVVYDNGVFYRFTSSTDWTPSSYTPTLVDGYSYATGEIVSHLQGIDNALVNADNIPSDNTADALVGSSGTPSASNKFVTEADPRITSAIASKTGTYAPTTTDYCILCDGTFDVDLPAAASSNGNEYYIKNIGSGTITIDANSTELIDSAETLTVAAGVIKHIICDGAKWHTL